MWVGSEAGGLLLYQPRKRETNLFILYLSNTAGAQPTLEMGLTLGPCDQVVQRAYCVDPCDRRAKGPLCRPLCPSRAKGLLGRPLWPSPAKSLLCRPLWPSRAKDLLCRHLWPSCAKGLLSFSEQAFTLSLPLSVTSIEGFPANRSRFRRWTPKLNAYKGRPWSNGAW